MVDITPGSGADFGQRVDGIELPLRDHAELLDRASLETGILCSPCKSQPSTRRAISLTGPTELLRSLADVIGFQS